MMRSTLRRLFFGVVAGFILSASAFAQTYSANIQLTIDNTAGGVSFTTTDILASGGHPQINSASCTNNSSGGAFRYRIDGGAPTTTVGVEVPEGGALLFGTTQALVNFKAIRTGGSSAVLSCTFSAETPMPPVYPVGAGGGGGSVGSDVNIAEVGGVAVVTNLPVDCNEGCAAATSDPDDGSIATGQTNSNANSLTMGYDGSVWRRLTFLAGNGAAAATNRLGTLPGIAETGSLPTLTDGRDSALYVNTNGVLYVGGALATNGVAAATNRAGTLPAVVNNSAPSYTDGRDAALSVTTGGAQRVMITNSAGTATSIATDGTFGSAVPATGPAIGYRGESTTPSAVDDGDLVSPWADLLGRLVTKTTDPCSDESTKVYFPVDIVTATTTEIANQSAGNYFRICSVNLVAGGAQNVAIVEDDTDTCGSPTAGMNGGVTAGEGWVFAANGGISLGNGAGTVMRSSVVNRYVCIITSAAQQLSGTIVYSLAP